jgi:dipeptidyl aminopeptidase/acylaminoacyl peptidase
VTRRVWRVIFALLLFSCAAFAAPADADNLDPLLDPVFSARYVDQVAIAPDGHRVAWVQSSVADEHRYRHEVFIARVAPGAQPQALAAAAGVDQYGIAWSPDGKSLAFLRRGFASEKTELMITDADGRSPRTLASLSGELSAVAWSPRGASIALLQQTTRKRENPGSALHSLAGGDVRQQRIVTVGVSDGRVRAVSPAELYVYEYDWSPDDSRFAATAAPARGEDEWWTAQLYVVDIRHGGAKPLYKPPLQIAYPKWSPDGRSIALIGGLMSDFIAPGGEVFLVDAATGHEANLTPGLKSSVTWLAWTSPSRLLTGEIVDGEGAFAVLDAAGGQRHVLWHGPDAPFASEVAFQPFGYSLSLAADGNASAGIRTSFDHAPEVWAGTLGKWQQVSKINRPAQRSWGDARSIHWTSDGMSVQGWLLYPRDYSPGKKYPLVTLVHGGPAGASLAHWAVPFDNVEVLSQLGYFVFYPNPRGSLGLGEAFTRGNVRDFGYGDLRDIESGVREIVRTLPVDPQRIGITGWSYGGFMAMWAITQTDLFKASVAGPGVSDWQSYYGQVDMQQWVVPYFGASAYEEPAIYAHSSPLSFIKRARTPTLMYVGERDNVCPSAQSLELWRALKRLGIATDLLIYPREGHGITEPADQRDVTKETVHWFEKYLAPQQPH